MLGLYLPSQTWLCDIWPIRVRKPTNWPSMGMKSLVAHVWKLYMLNHQPRDIRHNSKFFETSCGLAMHAVLFPTCLQRLGPYGSRRLSESFIWLYGTRFQRTQITHRTPVCMCPCTSKKDDFIRTSQGIEYQMLRSYAWDARVCPGSHGQLYLHFTCFFFR